MLVLDLMGKFSKQREKEESLGEVPPTMTQDKKEVTSAIEKIHDIQKRTDMRGWHKYGKTKRNIHV